MSRMLAIDWDRHRCHCVTATQARRGVLRVTGVEDVPIESGDDSTDEDRLVEALQGAVSRLKFSKGTVLVTVGRGRVDVLEFSIPKADESELPLFVQNTAMRLSNSISEDTLLDFIVSESASGDTLNVTAMVLSHDEMERITRVCARVGLAPDRVLVRPYSLVSAIPEGVTGTALLVGPGRESADVALVKDERIVLARTVQLPYESSEREQADYLARELRRSLHSLSTDLATQDDIDRVIVFGPSESCTQAAAELSAQLDLPVSQFDVLEPVEARSESDECGRFAGLIGMLADEAAGKRHAVDFVDPRRPKPPQSHRKTILYAAGAVSLLVACGWYFVWSSLSEIDAQNARLATELKKKKENVKRGEQKLELANAVANWRASRIVWLDELRDLSVRLPPGRDVRLQQLTMASSRGGTIRFRGLAREPSVVQRMENAIRDDFHEPTTPGLEERQGAQGHAWSFQTRLSVRARPAVEESDEETATADKATKKKSTKKTVAKASAKTGK